MKLLEILTVSEDRTPGWYKLNIVAEFGHGVDVNVFYLSPDDHYGLSDEVREAVAKWIAEGKPVGPAPVLTQEERWAELPFISRRQLLLALFAIGITEAQVDAAIGSDIEGQIEWKNASNFYRAHPLIVSLSVEFGLPSSQVDTLWPWASTL